MSDRDRIPTVQVGSGEKFVNDRGITAIKDGIKSSGANGQRLEKPDWLRIRVRGEEPVAVATNAADHESHRAMNRLPDSLNE